MVELAGEKHKASHVRCDDSFGETFDDDGHLSDRDPHETPLLASLTPMMLKNELNKPVDARNQQQKTNVNNISAAKPVAKPPAKNSTNQITSDKSKPTDNTASKTQSKPVVQTKTQTTLSQKPVPPTQVSNSLKTSQKEVSMPTNLKVDHVQDKKVNLDNKTDMQDLTQTTVTNTRQQKGVSTDVASSIVQSQSSKKLIKTGSTDRMIADVRHGLMDKEHKKIKNSSPTGLEGNTVNTDNIGAMLSNDPFIVTDKPVQKVAAQSNTKPAIKAQQTSGSNSSSQKSTKPPISTSSSVKKHTITQSSAGKPEPRPTGGAQQQAKAKSQIPSLQQPVEAVK